MGIGSTFVMVWLNANLVFFFLLSLSNSPFFSFYFLAGAASWLWGRIVKLTSEMTPLRNCDCEGTYTYDFLFWFYFYYSIIYEIAI